MEKNKIILLIEIEIEQPDGVALMPGMKTFDTRNLLYRGECRCLMAGRFEDNLMMVDRQDAEKVYSIIRKPIMTLP